jgi:hypothetical protein
MTSNGRKLLHPWTVGTERSGGFIRARFRAPGDRWGTRGRDYTSEDQKYFLLVPAISLEAEREFPWLDFVPRSLIDPGS